MNNFVEKNQKEREEFIMKWSKIVRENKYNWRNEQTKLINSQILSARNFYDNLIKTKGGYEKIIKKFNITNKRIIERLKKDNIGASEIKLIVREHKKFCEI